MSGWRGWWLATLVVTFVLAATRDSSVAGGREPTSRDLDLITTAASGNTARVKRLLVAGASVRAADARGVTALIAAAYRNHVHVARVLIQAGADVNAQDRTRQSAFLIATSEGYVELLRLTLEGGADVRRTDSYDGTGLIRAAHHGHVEVVRELLRAKTPIDHVNRLGWTALLEAIILGDGGPRHTETVRLLVEAGADVNLADGDGVTPLAHARRRGQTRIVEILERAGAK
ncbi:MAG TPA: ankyrin repeat domain-containing protein [Methylomirabilota bacterium]|nr:ankyrin repeat domain-containing protein [Methylomirabilota bacterium]